MKNINILAKLYSLKLDLKNIKDLEIINNLIEKYKLNDIRLKEEYSIKDFGLNSKFISKYIGETYFNNDNYDKKLEKKAEKFRTTQTYKDLVILRIKLNKETSCYLKNTYRDTLNLYTIETINKYFKL